MVEEAPSKDDRSGGVSSLSEILGEHFEPSPEATLDNTPESRVRTALLQRPRFTIQARLTLLFVVLFLVGTILGGTAWLILSEIEQSTQLVAITEAFANEIHEARRYEKNYFLYRSELSNVLQHLDEADRLFGEGSKGFRAVVGTVETKALLYYLGVYRTLIDDLIAKDRAPAFHDTAEFKEMASSLRENGAKMLSISFEIIDAEREQISSSISLARKAFLAMFAALLAISVYVGIHISRHIIARLNRLMVCTRRLANGDFSPILPTRKYKDEFSNLAIALNHMMYELERRHSVLVESHKMRAVGNLTAGVAHELNNPINNILLTSEMLKEDYERLSDDARIDMVNDLIAQADRAQTVVSNLLDFARESETRVEPLHIDKLLQETTRLAQNQIKLNKIQLHLDAENSLPPTLGDRALLVQVFLNLILNAIDAMPKGGHLFVRAVEEEETGFFAIHIQDSGVGIPSHLLNSVFDPFFTTKPTGKGTGLGLAVTQGIVEKHGGDIEVMSKVGVGTTFTVHLPCVPVPAKLAQTGGDGAPTG